MLISNELFLIFLFISSTAIICVTIIASDVFYDSSESKLSAANVQEAIDTLVLEYIEKKEIYIYRIILELPNTVMKMEKIVRH